MWLMVGIIIWCYSQCYYFVPSTFVPPSSTSRRQLSISDATSQRPRISTLVYFFPPLIYSFSPGVTEFAQHFVA